MLDMQKMIDLMCSEASLERSQTQFTLGELINSIKLLEPDIVVTGLSASADSYRGYYVDLAFEPGDTTVGELLKVAEESLGKTFTGYKGGDYTMNKVTPLWIAEYGDCGVKLMGFKTVDNTLVAVTEEEVW